MNNKKLLFALLLNIIAFGFLASGVSADTYGQTTCTSTYGTYGQSGCGKTVEASKSAVYLADTALDTPSLLVAGSIVLSGVGALVLKKKIA